MKLPSPRLGLLLVPLVSLAWLEAAPAPKKKTSAAITNSIRMKFVRIPAGKFLMGSPATETSRNANEGPQHEVEISKPFYLGVHEVTQEEYEKVVGKNPSWFSSTGGGRQKVANLATKRFPVETVTWLEAQEFCKKLGERKEEKTARRTYRLPTEAEWEYACRAGAKKYSVFHFGDSLSSAGANIHGNRPYGGAAAGVHLGRTRAVGSYKPNAFGLYDMHGNVFEWCSDRLGGKYYDTCKKQGTVKDPRGPAQGTDRIHRGGAWAYDGYFARSALRGHYGPTSNYNYVGFRVVCAPAP